MQMSLSFFTTMCESLSLNLFNRMLSGERNPWKFLFLSLTTSCACVQAAADIEAYKVETDLCWRTEALIITKLRSERGSQSKWTFFGSISWLIGGQLQLFCCGYLTFYKTRNNWFRQCLSQVSTAKCDSRDWSFSLYHFLNNKVRLWFRNLG